MNDWTMVDEGWGRRSVEFATLSEPANCREYVALHQLLGVTKGERLLDIACGAGLAVELAALRGAECAGIDASERLVNIARDRSPNADLRVGDMHALPWDEDSFDIVTSFRGIWGTTPQALDEVRRVLKPGGRLGITVWGHIKASPGAWALSPFLLASEPKVENQAAMVSLGRPRVGEALLLDKGFEEIARNEIPCVWEFSDPATYARALASTGPAYEAIQSVGEEAFLRGCVLFGECAKGHDRHHQVVAYSSDLTNAQWNLLEPLLLVPSKRGPKHRSDLRHVVDAMLYISHTGCQWRFLPEQFGPWTRVWSQFRRWSRNGTWTRLLTTLHATSRMKLGKTDSRPSMVVIDTHLARGASNGGLTFHNQGGPYGRTNGSKRIVCVDVTGLPLCVRVVPASTSEASAVEQILNDLAHSGADGRLELVLVDRGTAASAATRLSTKFNYEVRRVGWDELSRNEHGAKIFRPIRHAWRVEVAHGRLVRRRRLARCFENTVASATGWLHVASITEVLRVLC
jgi:transposase/SAM-dependent methyltransferase